MLTRDYPLSGIRVWDKDIWSFTAYQGEASPISVVRTEARHPISAITTIPGSEKVLRILHYDVGFVIARQLAREFNFIDAATDPALRTTINQLIQLHFHTQASKDPRQIRRRCWAVARR